MSKRDLIAIHPPHRTYLIPDNRYVRRNAKHDAKPGEAIKAIASADPSRETPHLSRRCSLR